MCAPGSSGASAATKMPPTERLIARATDPELSSTVASWGTRGACTERMSPSDASYVPRRNRVNTRYFHTLSLRIPVAGTPSGDCRGVTDRSEVGEILPLQLGGGGQKLGLLGDAHRDHQLERLLHRHVEVAHELLLDEQIEARGRVGRGRHEDADELL